MPHTMPAAAVAAALAIDHGFLPVVALAAKCIDTAVGVVAACGLVTPPP